MFNFSETDTDFDYANDITVSGGTLSQITSVEYEFTSTNQGVKSISIEEGAFQDLSGNLNEASNVVEFTYDSIRPSMTITAGEINHGNVSNINVLSLSFESSEDTVDFNEDDVICEGGTLTNFESQSNSLYTATFTATNIDGEKIIRVSSDSFHDAAGNGNVGNGNSGYEWTLVFRHDSTNGVFFNSPEEALSTNTDNPSAAKYSILDQIEEIGNIDGTFKFKLHWPEYDRTNIWSQTCNPVINTCT